MKSLFAFMKKEFMEQFRSGKVMILGLIFMLFGIMNPAIAKLTPWLLETMADSLAESGMIVTEVNISAMDSWVQYYKNLPMGLIVFVLLESSIFTKEYSAGSLVLALTKGLERYKVVISKTVVLAMLWTFCYWLCFGITYGYNAYFWDNALAQNLMFSALCWWIFGVMIVAIVVVFSAGFRTNTSVLLGTGGTVLAFFLLGLLPKFSKYLPTYLMDGNSLIYGITEAKTYIPTLTLTIALGIVCFGVSIPIFNKKQL